MFENKVAVSLAPGLCVNWPNPWLKFRIYTALWLPVYLLSWCPELGGRESEWRLSGNKKMESKYFELFSRNCFFWICLHTDISSGFSTSRSFLYLIFYYGFPSIWTSNLCLNFSAEFYYVRTFYRGLPQKFYQSLSFVNFYWLSYVCSWPSIHPHDILWPSFHPPWHIMAFNFFEILWRMRGTCS
jgi:hypothetical protein